MNFEIKCFVGDTELDADKLSEIVVDDYVINSIVSRVNRRGAADSETAVYND